jgi:hypothetical protein
MISLEEENYNNAKNLRRKIQKKILHIQATKKPQSGSLSYKVGI